MGKGYTVFCNQFYFSKPLSDMTPIYCSAENTALRTYYMERTQPDQNVPIPVPFRSATDLCCPSEFVQEKA